MKIVNRTTESYTAPSHVVVSRDSTKSVTAGWHRPSWKNRTCAKFYLLDLPRTRTDEMESAVERLEASAFLMLRITDLSATHFLISRRSQLKHYFNQLYVDPPLGNLRLWSMKKKTFSLASKSRIHEQRTALTHSLLTGFSELSPTRISK